MPSCRVPSIDELSAYGIEAEIAVMQHVEQLRSGVRQLGFRKSGRCSLLLTPTEMERLTIYVAAELARKHKAKGLPLNHPEAVAYHCRRNPGGRPGGALGCRSHRLGIDAVDH